MNSSDFEIKILEPQKDRLEWMQLVSALALRCQDVFLLPGCAQVYENLFRAKAGLFYLKAADVSVVHVYLRRPINTLPFLASSNNSNELFDVISPEYSGPVMQCPDSQKEEFMKLFWQEFNRFCLKENIVAEFGRLNPYYNDDIGLLNFIQAQLNRQIVYLDLKLSDKEIWSGFSKGNKSSIKKARKEGVSVKRSSSEDDIKTFYSLYALTMQRNQAAEFYYFSEDFFQDLFRQLEGNISLFTAAHKNKVIAASVFLHYSKYIHYYFSGSDEECLDLCPNNLILFEAINWAKMQGFETFSLGGGYHNSGQDSLFKFKSSFSEGRADFYTYRRIHSKDLYDDLVKKYCDFNKLDAKTLEGESFFPLYRR